MHPQLQEHDLALTEPRVQHATHERHRAQVRAGRILRGAEQRDTGDRLPVVEHMGVSRLEVGVRVQPDHVGFALLDDLLHAVPRDLPAQWRVVLDEHHVRGADHRQTAADHLGLLRQPVEHDGHDAGPLAGAQGEQGPQVGGVVVAAVFLLGAHAVAHDDDFGVGVLRPDRLDRFDGDRRVRVRRDRRRRDQERDVGSHVGVGAAQLLDVVDEPVGHVALVSLPPAPHSVAVIGPPVEEIRHQLVDGRPRLDDRERWGATDEELPVAGDEVAGRLRVDDRQAPRFEGFPHAERVGCRRP